MQWLSSLVLCVSDGYPDLAMTVHYTPRKNCRHFGSEPRRLLHNDVYGIAYRTFVSYIVQNSLLSADALKTLFLQKELWCRAGTKLHWATQPVDLMGQGATVTLSLFFVLWKEVVSGCCVPPNPPDPLLGCSGRVTEWHWNIQDVTEIAKKFKLHVVATKIYLKIFVRLQGDLASFKCFFPQNAYNLNMINVLYKIAHSTTSSISKICCVLMGIKQEQETVFYLTSQITSLLMQQHR